MNEMPDAKDYMRFLSKVDVRGADECWPWTAASTGPYGRGTFRYRRRTITAPTFALEWIGGVSLDGRWALHTCHNPPCCNPSHLYPGTREDNTRDMIEARRFVKGKLSEEQVREIRARHAAGQSISSLAREYSWKLSKMQDVIHRRRYGWVA